MYVTITIEGINSRKSWKNIRRVVWLGDTWDGHDVNVVSMYEVIKIHFKILFPSARF